MSVVARWVSVSLVLFVGCEGGLGGPVVDQGRRFKEEGRECLRVAPRCGDSEAAPEELDVGAQERLPECDLGADAAAARIVTTLRDCTLSLSATEPEEREIGDSLLDNVRIELDSRVRLRIVDSQLFRVSVEIHQVDPDVLASLHVSHTDLRSTRLGIDQIELVSCFMNRVRVESSELSGVDIETKDSVLLAAKAVLSASRMQSTRFGQCETLLIAGSRVTDGRFDACEGVTRVYDVEATDSSFDGQLEADVGTFVDNRFGLRGFTQMHGWNTSIDNSAFCAGFDSLRFSGGAIVCSSCAGPLAQPDPDVCMDTIEASTEANYCEALETLPTCSRFPRHERPIVGL